MSYATNGVTRGGVLINELIPVVLWKSTTFLSSRFAIARSSGETNGMLKYFAHTIYLGFSLDSIVFACSTHDQND